MTGRTVAEVKGTIFLAGATGAVGIPLSRLLVMDGWRVVGTTRKVEKVGRLQELGVEPVMVDALDREALLEAVVAAKPEVVISQLTDLPPAMDPELLAAALERNAHLREVGTANLVAAAIAAGARRVVAQSIAFANVPSPRPYDETVPLNVGAAGLAGVSARAVASMERQVLQSGLEGVVLRYGRLYGAGTGFDEPNPEAPLHVDAAADAARRAATKGSGIYNIAEDDGIVVIERAKSELGWSPLFRL